MGERVILYGRDLLYPTGDPNNPGSINVKVFSPTKEGYIPILIESRSPHLIKEYIYSIIKIVQNDIFNRVSIDIKVNAVVIVKNKGTENEYLKVLFYNNTIEFCKIENLDEILE